MATESTSGGAQPQAKSEAAGKSKAKLKRPVRSQASKEPRAVSQIAFPYVDLEAAIAVARALLGAGGVPITRDQLAAAMKLAPGSGAFAWKIGAARIFGLIEPRDGKQQLTDLGFAITEADDSRQKAARAQSFLTVPLYKRVYDEFKGRQLPPRPNGLEQAFVRMGVPAKQRDKARFAFERAAKQAGYFDNGTDRLVEPVIVGTNSSNTSADSKRSNDRPVPENPKTVPANGLEKELHPFILGLLKELPEARTEWTRAERVKWLQAAAQMFELIYRTEETGPVDYIEVIRREI